MWFRVSCLLAAVTHALSYQNGGPVGQPCTQDGYRFVFTECDTSSQRWRVAVPKSDACRLPNAIPEAPVLLHDCSLTCDAGNFYNSSSLRCEACEAGYYSAGDGLNFDAWQTVPTEFLRRSEALHTLTQPTTNCDKYDWKPRGDHLQSGVGPCVSALILPVKLAKDGELTFTYQYPDSENVLFVFEAQNELCEFITADVGKAEDGMPQKTEQGQWRNMTIKLNSGPNVLQWKTLGIYDESHPVLIQKIHVSGVGYISNCTKCPAGTYTKAGATFCQACEQNTYSKEGSDRCLTCPDSTFAPPGSSYCVERPKCSKKDYIETHSPCDSNKKTRVNYEWRTPKICRDDVPGAVQLPKSGVAMDCPPCNPGMESRPNSVDAAYKPHEESSHCGYCPEGQYSDGLGPCRPCPPSTMPKYGLYINRWTRWPEHMVSTCMTVDKDSACASKAWILADNYVEAVMDLHEMEASWSVLILDVPGFRVSSQSHMSSVATLSFDFQLDCQIPCELTFLEAIGKKNSKFGASWNQTQGRTTHRHTVTKNLTYSFSWAFQPRFDDTSMDMMGYRERYKDNKGRSLAVARIFNINITDTIVGGASECLPCPEIPVSENEEPSTTETPRKLSLIDDRSVKSAPVSSCIPCPAGYYVQPEGRHANGTNVASICLPCPAETVLSGSSFQHKIGREACSKCGPGLAPSANKQYCMTNCSYTWGGFTYDLTPLAGPSVATESRLFTVAGNWYFHLFNISLCGDPLATCRNNVSLDADDVSIMEESVVGHICRSTIVPDRRKPRPSDSNTPRSLSIQSISLGDRLVGVTRDPVLDSMRVHPDFVQPRSSRSQDIHFYFKTVGDENENCPKGRATIITLRCDPAETKEGKKSFPPSCPASTCDGCTYHILWKTAYACPRCTDAEYKLVKGECIDGMQSIHRFPEKDCLPTTEFKEEEKQPCINTIPLSVQLTVTGSVGACLLLCILLSYLYKKTRRLEYKYMRLVSNGEPHDARRRRLGSASPDDEEPDDELANEGSTRPLSGRIIDVIQDPEPQGASLSESCALGPGEEEDEEDTVFMTSDERFNRKLFSMKNVTSGSFFTSAMRFASSVMPGTRNQAGERKDEHLLRKHSRSSTGSIDT